MAGRVRAWLAAGDRRATQMTGPVPCFYSRLNGLYRWQIVLRGPQPASLLRGQALGDWRVEVNPPNLL
jgi:primosomal protein N' (replication factor Y)